MKASSGEEALTHVRDEDFALVLMDVRLPGLNGVETARRMRQLLALRPLPLIFLTGASAEESVVATAYSTGGWTG
ncbi:response regulator [Cystobacter fuscus]